MGTTTPPGPIPLRGPWSSGNEDEEPLEIVGTALMVGDVGHSAMSKVAVYQGAKEPEVMLDMICVQFLNSYS